MASAGTVLLVEDEHSIGSLVRAYLEKERYRVIWVHTGEEALAELTRHAIRIVVLDVGLPGLDGFDVCREVRRRSQVPILMLTARDEEADRVAGLEVGADDYVSKPFSPRELVARMKAVLRRTESASDQASLTLGDVVVLPEAREVSVGGEHVELTGKEFDLLAQREKASVCPFCRLGELERFLEPQDERVVPVPLDGSSAFLPLQRAQRLRHGAALDGTVTVDDTRYLYAARLVNGKGFVL